MRNIRKPNKKNKKVLNNKFSSRIKKLNKKADTGIDVYQSTMKSITMAAYLVIGIAFVILFLGIYSTIKNNNVIEYSYIASDVGFITDILPIMTGHVYINYTYTIANKTTFKYSIDKTKVLIERAPDK